ncbi:ABC transporter ATP-binding protein [Streptomyces sp. NBC_01267]|uniref:ABC transporter ATP-binding protein n=1 Tax=unclassified Streptomyces TaxID=2593676 RepID=UPI0022512686|nr:MULTISPECIES: ABC transporter ATP-binding protein [unclassified Streptomyces]MCX4551421.1 ABC transporter ATP-binding protein [Streptomyces sp. NBC_01500]WSC22814.1 ABC transporter ATP-binding protein [Streptomyces sp. NBC_01766]WSV56726.1 ABC transporter ATP-binding protein [Streptomyces sp. NBC_01014]
MTQTADTGPAVSFTGAVKTFGAVRAVDGADLEIHRGETVALLGRNGAGKSTTIGLLLGLDQPDSGQVRLFGRTPEQAVRAGLVGAMLQTGQPIPRVTVRELVAFVASTYPRPLPVSEALDMAGLAEFAGRRVDKLSGGQTQRVRFAVALAGNPELIVLDEPTAALDVEARRAFWDSMRAYARRGNTVLFSTHYLEEADDNADRIVVIDRGRIVADGSAELIKRSAGGSLVSFDLAGRGTEGLPLLPGVTAVEIRGDRASLRTDDSDATVVALAELGAIRGLAVAPATLEDAFLRLTSHEPASHELAHVPGEPTNESGHGTAPRPQKADV